MAKPSYHARDIFPKFRTRSLRGKRVGIHGLGAIPTWDASPRCGEFAMRNVAKFLRGEAVEGVVTPETCDHST